VAREPNKDAKFFPGGRADGNRGGEGWGERTPRRTKTSLVSVSDGELELANTLRKLATYITFGGEQLGDGKVSVLSALADSNGNLLTDRRLSPAEYAAEIEVSKQYLKGLGIKVEQTQPIKFPGHDNKYEVRYLADAKAVTAFLRKPEVAALMKKFRDHQKKATDRDPEWGRVSSLLDAGVRANIVMAAGIACRAAGEELIDFYPSVGHDR
jgi:hypothetical protein